MASHGSFDHAEAGICPRPVPPVTMVVDCHDDALHTHTALAAHHPPSGRALTRPTAMDPATRASPRRSRPPRTQQTAARTAGRHRTPRPEPCSLPPGPLHTSGPPHRTRLGCNTVHAAVERPGIPGPTRTPVRCHALSSGIARTCVCRPWDGVLRTPVSETVPGALCAQGCFRRVHDVANPAPGMPETGCSPARSPVTAPPPACGRRCTRGAQLLWGGTPRSAPLFRERHFRGVTRGNERDGFRSGGAHARPELR